MLRRSTRLPGVPRHDRAPAADRVAGPGRAGRRPRRRPGRADDARREGRPARQHLAGPRRHGRHGPDAGRRGVRAVLGGGHHRRPRPPHPPLRQCPGRRGDRAAQHRRPAGAGAGGQPVRHPGAGPRGVPDRAQRVGRHDLPHAGELGGDLRPRARRADGAPDRRPDGPARHPPGSGAGARRDARPAVGPGRGDPRRGPLPRRHDGRRLRPRPPGERRRRDPQALPRLLRLARGPQPRAGLDGHPGARRRDAAAVRDGAARRRALGDERLHRHRRDPLGRRRGAPHHAAARHPRLRGHRRRRLLLRRLPAPAAPHGRRPRRGGPPVARRRASTSSCRRRTPTARRCSRRSPAVGWTRRSWTARCGGCWRTSASSGCSTRTGRPSSRRRSTSTRRRPASSPATWPAARSSCSTTTAPCPSRPGRRVALVGPNADTADAMLGCYTFPMHVLAHHPGHEPGLAIPTLREVLAGDGRPDVHERGCAVGVPGRTGTSPRTPRQRSRRRSRPPRAPTCASRSSATGPASSAGARPARAATRPTCACPAARRSCSSACSPQARPSSRCCWWAAPTTSAARPTGSRRCSAGSSSARRVRAPWPTCSSDGPSRRVGCR